MSGPLVSIIIPNYNYGDFIASAIESALNQSYPNVETIVVDDGSSDSSCAVMASYSGRIDAIVKKNGGPSSARNAGIRLSRGELLLFLDSDDILFPRAVEKLVNAYLVGGSDQLVYGDSLFFHGSASWSVKRRNPSGHIWRELLNGNFICCHEVLVLRRLVLEENGFDEAMRMCEDFDFWLRLARHHEFRHVNVTVAQRRFHESMTSNLADELQRGAGAALKKQWCYARCWLDKLAIASARGKNFHQQAYLAKVRTDYALMRRLSCASVRWQPWRIKNWLYLGASFLFLICTQILRKKPSAHN